MPWEQTEQYLVISNKQKFLIYVEHSLYTRVDQTEASSVVTDPFHTEKKACIQNGATTQDLTLKKDYNFHKDMIYTRQMTRLEHHTYDASVMG